MKDNTVKISICYTCIGILFDSDTLNISYYLFLPIDASKKVFPILESLPIALATSDISPPVLSQTADSALILEIRCAKKALAAWKNIYIIK